MKPELLFIKFEQVCNHFIEPDMVHLLVSIESYTCFLIEFKTWGVKGNNVSDNNGRCVKAVVCLNMNYVVHGVCCNYWPIVRRFIAPLYIRLVVVSMA